MQKFRTRPNAHAPCTNKTEEKFKAQTLFRFLAAQLNAQRPTPTYFTLLPSPCCRRRQNPPPPREQEKTRGLDADERPCLFCFCRVCEQCCLFVAFCHCWNLLWHGTTEPLLMPSVPPTDPFVQPVARDLMLPHKAWRQHLVSGEIFAVLCGETVRCHSARMAPCKLDATRDAT